MTPAVPVRPPLAQALAAGMDALARGNASDARGHALRAVRLDPLSEEAWLLLAAVAPPQTRSAYLNHLLEIHPGSESARQALAELASQPSRNPAAGEEARLPSPEEILAQINADSPAPRQAESPTHTRPSPPATNAVKRRGFRWTALLISISCILALSATAFAGVVTYAQEAPVMARVIRQQSAIPPTFTPSSTPSITPSFTPTFTATFTPSPTYTATNTLPPTATPWPDAYIIPGANGERWIDVDISSQTVTAYEGNTPIRQFIVSTGTSRHPTVTGRFRIYVKLRYDTMAGPGYYLPNVPFVMYFYQGYSIHGTYWHHNFGTPMSHGCVNMYTPDAEWMFYFASVGTLVNSHW
jgi:lipoprotein-anchoring transpeptidase ErfK/SrfK